MADQELDKPKPAAKTAKPISTQKEDTDLGFWKSQVEKLKEQVGLLTKIADKSRLARLQKPEDQLMRVQISLYEGKVVTGWKLLTNYVQTRGNKVVEDQKVEYTLEDGDKVQMEYIDTVAKTMKAGVEVDKMSKAKDGSITYTVSYNGNTYDIDSRFIN